MPEVTSFHPSPRAAWREYNASGLAHAQSGAWTDAIAAFRAAFDIAQAAPYEGEVAELELDTARALLCSNLANASFRAGLLQDAQLYAERSCSLRVALFGENAVPVARIRNDLAVILGAQGRFDEALSLVNRAIGTVDAVLGDEDPHLGPLLENAARLALDAGQVAAAEPLLLRLHALLGSIDAPTASADSLLMLVAQARAIAPAVSTPDTIDRPPATSPPVASPPVTHMTTPAHSFHAGPMSNSSDDVLLRDAVALTGELLRNTPAENVAHITPANVERHKSPHFGQGISVRRAMLTPLDNVTQEISPLGDISQMPAPEVAGTDEPASINGVLDVLDLEMALDGALLSTIPPAPPRPNQKRANEPLHADAPPKSSSPAAPTEDIFAGATFDLVEPPPPTLSFIPKQVPVTPSKANPLGFVVEYTIPVESHQPLGSNTGAIGGDAEPQVNPEGATQAMDMGNTAAMPGDAPVPERRSPIQTPPELRAADAPQRRATDRLTPVVMPALGAPRESMRTNDEVDENMDDDRAPRLSLLMPESFEPIDETTAPARPGPGLRPGRALVAEPSRLWLVGWLLIVLVASIALWFWFGRTS